MGAGAGQFRPDYAFEHVTGITPRFLAEQNIHAVILDLDNTLTRWEQGELAPGVQEWVRALQEARFRLVILSNGLRAKQRKVAEELEVPVVVARLPKPCAAGFRRALKTLGVPAQRAAMIGDIVFTDIWGANRLGILSILVEPLSSCDFPGTKLWRLLERLFRLRRPCREASRQ